MGARRKALTRTDQTRMAFTRWVLFLLAANEAAGLPEVSRQRLHALLFMSFAASRYYAIEPLQRRAKRTDHGPYYRSAHMALGGLVLSGLVSVEGFKPHLAVRELQFEGVFRPTLRGLEVARVLRRTITGTRLYRFLLDLCLASAYATSADQEDSIPQPRAVDGREAERIDGILAQDLTYQYVVERHGNHIDLDDFASERTPTVKGLDSIEQRLDEEGAFNRKDVLVAYQTLLLHRSQARAA